MTDEQHNIFYVDESGDLVFFDKKKRILDFEQPDIGASRYFILGFIRLGCDIDIINNSLEALKLSILADPVLKNYFKPKNNSLYYFHAKEDHVLIIDKVLRHLQSLDFSFQCIVRRKQKIRKKYEANKIPSHKKNIVNEKKIYHDSAAYLFKRNLHISENKIVLSKRGKTFSEVSIKEAIIKSQKKYLKQYGLEGKNINIFIGNPSNHYGLQIVDYILWTINRFYNAKDSGWFELVKDKVSLIIDYDHPDSEKEYGLFFNKANPIGIKAI